jgi:hypothetical protein
VYHFNLTAARRAAVLNDTIVGNGANRKQGVSKKSMHITSTTPVSVYGISYTTEGASMDATNVLPVDSWGTNYYQISYLAAFDPGLTSRYHDGYLVVAKEDGTDVFVNGVKNATLSRGEVFSDLLIRNDNSATGPILSYGDLTGTHITSSKPVAFFTVNQLVFTPSNKYYGDNLFQQLNPVNQWGTRFLVPGTVQKKGRIRIMASQAGTNISLDRALTPITTNGLGTSYGQTNNGGRNSLTNLSAGQFIELEIDENGCYITANNPIGVCSYLVGGQYQTAVPSYTAGGLANQYQLCGDPAMAWIPPIEQGDHNILTAPFIQPDTSSLLIVSSRLRAHYALLVVPTNTKDQTRLSINGAASNPLTGITWINNAASGYSFASYKYPYANTTDINASYIFENQGGITVGGYGLGSAVSYYYLAGSATQNLQEPPCPPRAVWTGAIDQDWHNSGNWIAIDENKNILPDVIPDLCTDVYIPGDLNRYPVLGNEANNCDNIWFMLGGEIGQQQFLTYSRAHVQLDYGLQNSAQATISDIRQIAWRNEDAFTTTHLQFSAKNAGHKLARSRWYMLSPSLQDIVSGDFAFGDFPRVFMRKFDFVTPSSGPTPVGQWTQTFANEISPLNPMEGFAVWMNEYNAGYGYREYGNGDGIAALPYGLNRQNGIIEFPFFENAEMSAARRIHNLNGNTSEFYYIWKNGANIEKIDRTDKDSYTRGANDKPYRFIGETYNAGKKSWELSNTRLSYAIPASVLSTGGEILVGNPFMSSIDFIKFLAENKDVIENFYRL